MEVVIIIPFIIGIIPMIIASQKGYNGCVWYIYGVLLFIFALPHALLLKPNEKALGMMQCPYCKETVKMLASICKYCGKSLTPEGENDQEEATINEIGVTTQQRECPSCKTITEVDATFCQKCGFKFGKIGCPNCNSTYTQKVNFCMKCGFDFTTLEGIDELFDEKQQEIQIDQPVKKEGKKQYTLNITAPEDKKKKYFLTKKLTEKTGKTFEQISEDIDKGIVLQYKDENKMISNKEIYESFGCTVEVNEEDIEEVKSVQE